MALVGLHAIAHLNSMTNLALCVRLERSPRVRRLAVAALVNYCRRGTGREYTVTVGTPARAEGQGGNDR